MVMLLLLVLSVGAMDVRLPTTQEYTLESHLPCPGFRIVWDLVVVLHHPHLQHPLHLHPHLQVLQVLDVDHLNGKEMDTAMMKTTMMFAIMMVEIVAVMMSTHNTVLPVNVLILNLETMMMTIVKTPNPQHGVRTEEIRENVANKILLTNVKKLAVSAETANYLV